ncbi:hypothetical protein FHS77_003247 [Paenochrobactrum gallinarii]|uniref:DUF3552 domain-containing protein n=1 Tax=Paenochrobactrum gallinarii TaxID=643673 RepID=A0A841LWA8_9HYPH|nr:hypothetical protein [Paenochrobactrum gallinarii]MBB6262665.1 hypothetical protein [Paenochrobactrum gallinarii]
MRVSLLIALFAPITLANEANAFYCSEPSAPFCATRFGSFDDQWDFDRCKREMESYKTEVEDFIECNNRAAKAEAERAADEAFSKAQRENDDAISEYSSTVDDFNRRAR